MPVSSWMTICVLRAMRAEKSVGSAIASSSALVWSDWVPPSIAAIASMVVRMTLLYGSCSVSDTPDVWQCVRSILERSCFAPRSVITRYQSVRAARSFAISMKKFMRSEEHTSELQSLMRISYAVFGLKIITIIITIFIMLYLMSNTYMIKHTIAE